MVRSGALTVVGDQSAATLRNIALQIDQFKAVVGRLLHNADRSGSLPTVVFAFGTRKAMEPALPLYKGRPAEIAGYFGGDPDANYIILSLENYEESARIVFHEYTHLLVRNAVASVPVWLNEGLAEFYSSYAVIDGGKTAVVGRPVKWSIPLLRERYLPLSELIAVDTSSALYNESDRRSIFYAESWALVHYLLTEVPNGGAAINKYSTAFAERRDPNQAFVDAFGTTPKEFDRQLRSYVNRIIFKTTHYTFNDRIAVSTPGAPRALSAGEAQAWMGDMQRRVGRVEEAAPRLEAAVAADPKSAVGHLGLGLLRLSTDRATEGLEAIGRAASLAPDDFLTQFTYGVSLLREDRGETDALRDRAIAALKRAAVLSPTSSDTFAWLAYAQMLSEATLADARASIERAISLAPGRAEYVLRYADVRLLQGEVAAARVMLKTIVSAAPGSRAAVGAEARLERIAESERRAAASEASRSIEAASRETPDATAPATRSRSVETTGIDMPDIARARERRLVLRRVGANEERVLGTLTRIDCSPAEVRFTVRAGDRVVVSTAKRMEDVELTSFLDRKDFTIACGSQQPADRVYLTWRRDANAPPAVVGMAVAVEFLPADYKP